MYDRQTKDIVTKITDTIDKSDKKLLSALRINIIIKLSEKFNRYYYLKCLQEKSYYCTFKHITHELVNVIFTLIKKNIIYQEKNLK